MAGHPAYDRRLEVALPFHEVRDDGMPGTEEEYNTVQEAGERIAAALAFFRSRRQRSLELAPLEPPAQEKAHREDDPAVHRREGNDRFPERRRLQDDRGAEQQHGTGPQVGQESVQERSLLRRVPERRPAVALDRLGRIRRRRLPPRRRLLGGRLAGRGF